MCFFPTKHVKITDSELVCLRCGEIKLHEIGRWITADWSNWSLGYFSSDIELGEVSPSKRAEELSTLVIKKKFNNELLRNSECIIFWIEDPIASFMGIGFLVISICLLIIMILLS